MTLPGQISYEARVVAQANVDFSDPANPVVSRFGFNKFNVAANSIDAVFDTSKLGSISNASLLGQIFFNVQAVEFPGSPPQIIRLYTQGAPGDIVIQAETVTGVANNWTAGYTAILNITVCIVDDGPYWPTSVP